MFFYTNNYATHHFFKGVAFVVTDRYGGVSAPPYNELNLAYHVDDDASCVDTNRSILLKEFNTYAKSNVDKIYYLNQIHGDKLIDLDMAKDSFLGDGDGILCSSKDKMSMIMVADCAPVLIYDEHYIRNDGGYGAYALLHVGRCGAFNHIISKAINTMKEKYDSASFSVFVGPCIKKCCYEIGEDVRSQMREIYGQKSEDYIVDSKLDMESIIKDEILQNSITNYHIMPYCTHLDELYSYRQSSTTGRFAMVAMLL